MTETTPSAPDHPRPRRLLLLGGTGFVGPALVEAALARGHHVTLFNRGRARPPAGVELRLGDRDPRQGDGLTALAEGVWDAVIDVAGYYPRLVAASAGLLAPRVGRYVYISSVSAYRWPHPVAGDEDAALAELADPTIEEMGVGSVHYGGLKAACEAAVELALPGRSVVVRPGFIVGPGDPSGRFTYWATRFERGGEAAVPGDPGDPVQVLDVRDLAQWVVRLVEQEAVGRFNAVGPGSRRWGEVIGACREAGSAQPSLCWIPAPFMAAQSDLAFPIWQPPLGETQGFHTWQNQRAVRAGLRFRPMAQTVVDTLAWYRGQLKEEDGRVKLAFSPEQGAELLKRWRAGGPS